MADVQIPAVMTTPTAARYPKSPAPHLAEYGQKSIAPPRMTASSTRAMTPSVLVLR